MTNTPAQMYAQVCDDYRSCIDTYRETSDSWFIGWAVDMEQQVTINGWQKSQSVSDDDTISNHMQCPLDGVINVVHAFEAQEFIPIEGTLATISLAQPTPRGTKYTVIGEQKTNSEGIALFELDKKLYAGKRIAVSIEADVSKNDLEELFMSYDSLIDRSLTWLDGKWQGEQQGEWNSYLQNPLSASGVLAEFLDQVLDAIKDIWDDLKMIFELLTHPKKMYELVKRYCDPAELEKLLQTAKAEMAKMLILLQDEARLFLCINAIYSWCRTLTPRQVTVIVGSVLAAILVDTILSLIMPGGIFGKIVSSLGSTENVLDALV